MSKRRGLSLEEKREHMLQIFYDSQDFFLLKELEKSGPKRGVISQSVKDVVQSLVDDDLVLKDKIGTSVYFWSLPSCAGNQLRNTRNKLESDLLSRSKQLAELDEKRLKLKSGREDSDDREMALEEMKAIELQHKKLKEELSLFADNDPAALEEMKSAIESAHAAANRWTDNIFTLKQWCSSHFPEAKEQLERMYEEVWLTVISNFMRWEQLMTWTTFEHLIFEKPTIYFPPKKLLRFKFKLYFFFFIFGSYLGALLI